MKTEPTTGNPKPFVKETHLAARDLPGSERRIHSLERSTRLVGDRLENVDYRFAVKSARSSSIAFRVESATPKCRSRVAEHRARLGILRSSNGTR